VTIINWIRLGIGGAILVGALIIPIQDAQKRLLLVAITGLIYVPYGIALGLASRRLGYPLFVATAVGDLAIIFAVSVLLPATQILAMFAYIVILVVYSQIGGRGVGLVIAGAIVVLSATAEFLLTPVRELELATLIAFWIVLVVLTMSLHALTEQQRRLRQSLIELNEAKNLFLAAVSHDLSNPLTTIKGNAETLVASSEQLSKDTASDLLRRIVRNADWAVRTLRNLLDLHRGSDSSPSVRRQEVEMSRLVKDVVDVADPRGHVIELDLDPIYARVDLIETERIVENLLSNAIAHTPREARIVVHCHAENNGVVIMVEDEGPGIPNHMKDAIWDMFRSGKDTGTGVGLALVAKFAEMHGGRAWVEDGEEGGSRFCVHLPGASAVTQPGGSPPRE
jgi:signal transduction histidine kinase